MSKRSERAAAVTVGGEPRVNLLPPEVAQRKKARSARRGLVTLVVVIFLLVAAGYGYATFRALGAQALLAISQARTADLLAEQLKYADVTTLSGNVQAVKDARSLAVSTEVLWNGYYTKIRDVMPADTVFSRFVVDGRAPWEPEPGVSGPLRAPRVATITFIIVSAAPFPVEPFVSKLEKIPGFADVTPDNLGQESGVYRTQFTFNVSADALSGRFPVGEDVSN